jgi:hypothetical protein
MVPPCRHAEDGYDEQRRPDHLPAGESGEHQDSQLETPEHEQRENGDEHRQESRRLSSSIMADRYLDAMPRRLLLQIDDLNPRPAVIPHRWGIVPFQLIGHEPVRRLSALKVYDKAYNTADIIR